MCIRDSEYPEARITVIDSTVNTVLQGLLDVYKRQLLVLALFFVWKIFIQNVPEKRVAVILPESGDQRWDSLIKGMKQSAKENHIHLVICNTADIENAEAEKEAIEEQKNNHIDAFIVLPAPCLLYTSRCV